MRSLLRNLLGVALILGIVAGVGLAIVRVLRLQNLTVTSGSMAPLMVVGSRVVVQKGPDIKPNDVISFHNPETGGITTHIFGGYNADGTLMTKGLANEDADTFSPAPTKSDVIGRVVYHTSAFTWDFWNTKRGLGIVLLFISALILLMIAWMLGQERVAPGAHRLDSRKDSRSPQPV